MAKVTRVIPVLILLLHISEGWRDPGDKGQHVRSSDDFEQDWGRVFRLVFISGVATLTTMGNIFTISAIIVDDLLRKKGNSFLVSITLADLLITGIVLPASSVGVLGDIEDSENICRLQYGFTSVACLTAAIFTAIIGIENFLRLKALRFADDNRDRPIFQPITTLQPHHSYPPTSLLLVPTQHHALVLRRGSAPICTVWQVTVLNLIVWLVSGVIVLIHFIFMPQIMYALCERPKITSFGNHRLNQQLLFESLTVYGTCALSFVLLGGFGFLKTLCIMKSWRKPKPFLTSREFALVATNGWNGLARLIIWLPSVVATLVSILSIGDNRSVEFQHRLIPSSATVPLVSSNSSETVLNLQRLIIWPAILPSCLSSVINLLSNRDFRRCYGQFFHYCCCKTSVALTRRPRDPLRAGSDVRVHIIPGYNMYSSAPPVSGGGSDMASSTVQTRFIKCSPLKMNYNKRDVYEL